MFGGGESHTTSVKQQSNDVFLKSRHSRCVLGRKDTKDGPLCVITPEESGWYRAYVNIFYWTKLTRSWQRSSGIGFVCRTPVTRIFFIKLNPTIGSNVGVGTKGTARNCPQLSCYFLDRWDIWGAVWLSMTLRNKLQFQVVFIKMFSINLLSSGALLFIHCMFPHQLILLRPNQTWQSTLRRDFLVVSGQVIVLTSQQRDAVFTCLLLTSAHRSFYNYVRSQFN